MTTQDPRDGDREALKALLKSASWPVDDARVRFEVDEHEKLFARVTTSVGIVEIAPVYGRDRQLVGFQPVSIRTGQSQSPAFRELMPGLSQENIDLTAFVGLGVAIGFTPEA